MQPLAGFLKQLVEWIKPVALSLGGPGLFLVAFLDSSFLSLPEVSDILIVVLTVQHPARWLYYGLLTTAGSVLGCFALYSLARKGGEAFLRRWFSESHVQRGLRIFQKYGLLAIIVPSLLPPPLQDPADDSGPSWKRLRTRCSGVRSRRLARPWQSEISWVGIPAGVGRVPARS